MILEQIYTGCLAQGAYYIESEGEAVIIDPLREVQPYIDRAERSGAKIRYVLETHFHADFVSGHLDLSEKTGAVIVYGPTAKPEFDFYSAADGEELKVGKITIEVLHTPGHTMESTCYLLKDENRKPVALFSGDTLFIGDVGRPDLAQKIDPGLTQDKLAGLLYDSLRNRIMPLPDDVVVYPAHGAGSACGKNMSQETSDTLGHQKQTNYALRPGITKAEFIREVTSGLVKPPSYFPSNVLMNIKGYERIDDVLERGLRPLSPNDFEEVANERNALILDTRNAEKFTEGFIPNSINIGLRGSFAPWVGTLIPDIRQEILLVADPGTEEEVVTRLSTVGFDHVAGFLAGGFEQWRAAGKETDTIKSISAGALASLYAADNSIAILDVRKNGEFESEHIYGAISMPLDFINDSMTGIEKSRTYYVHCAGGYRSMIFISILRARGYNNLVNVTGGIKTIKATNRLPLTDYVCPTTQL